MSRGGHEVCLKAKWGAEKLHPGLVERGIASGPELRRGKRGLIGLVGEAKDEHPLLLEVAAELDHLPGEDDLLSEDHLLGRLVGVAIHPCHRLLVLPPAEALEWGGVALLETGVDLLVDWGELLWDRPPIAGGDEVGEGAETPRREVGKELGEFIDPPDHHEADVGEVILVVGGAYEFSKLLSDLAAGRLRTLADFIAACDGRPIPKKLAPIHREVYASFSQGDPTPFKSFRRREYEETVARMDSLPDEASEEVVLAEEIVLTREVIELCRYLKGKGVLIFGLTDKPDEASLPPVELRARGYPPLHRARMKLLGTSPGL